MAYINGEQIKDFIVVRESTAPITTDKIADGAVTPAKLSEEYYTQTEVDSKIASVYKVKGSKATYSDIEALTSSEVVIGDVWNALDTGSNYVCTDIEADTNTPSWDKLSETVDLSDYYNKTEVDNKVNEKQGTLTAGNNITISDDNVISAAAGTTDYNELTNKPRQQIALTTEGVDISTLDGAYDVIRAGKLVNDVGAELEVNTGAIIMVSKEDDWAVVIMNGFQYSLDITSNSWNNSYCVSYTEVSEQIKNSIENKIDKKQDKLDFDVPLNLTINRLGITSGYYTRPDDVKKAISAEKTVINTDDTTSFELSNNTEYRRNEVSTLSITLPVNIVDDYASFLVFSSGSTATTFKCPTDIKFTGDDCENNIFIPAANKRYNIGFWYDGLNINAVVRGA